LAVISTPFGARGIECAHMPTPSTVDEFVEKVEDLSRDGAKRRRAGRYNRSVAAREYDWVNISGEFGAVLANRLPARAPRPFFSVTVPTLDRPAKLRRLFDLLAQQSERDFEVIVVDQSATPSAQQDYGFDLTIVHSRVRGQAHARNLAAAVARGEVIVCTDDDCEPNGDWLAAARPFFAEPDVVGVEGRCFSDRRFDPAWRAVHNYEAEGQGFMTCNLFVTAEAFHRVGGFDPGFDDVQFRYDTDFGWRLRSIGKVPFSETAFVYHPPWPRNLRRESRAARDRLFEADPLLLRKHPDDYRQLFLRECHWLEGDAFWVPFLRGARKYEVELPPYVRAKRRQCP
jgi:glycosyltransferase involved in cell wall biosynthesis